MMYPTGEYNGLILAVYSITLSAGLPGNLLSLYVLIRKIEEGAKLTDVLLLSLNISDLVFLFFLPICFKETAEMRWNMNYFLCPFSTYITLINFYNSTLHLTAVSVDRYLAVVFPLKYKLKQHPQYAVIVSVIIWLVNLAHCSIVYYMQYHFSNGTDLGLDPISHNTCYIYFTQEQRNIIVPERLGISISFICVPLIICCFCYTTVIYRLSKLDNISPMKRSRAIALAMFTVLHFIICFLPFSVFHIAGYIIWDSPNWRVFPLLFSTLSPCLDPFVYYFSSKALQKTFKDSMQGILMWLQHLQGKFRRIISNKSSGETQQELTN